MLEYERDVGPQGKETIIKGTRCERCGYTSLNDDEDIWSSVGL
jgi:ribosomal protein L37E